MSLAQAIARKGVAAKNEEKDLAAHHRASAEIDLRGRRYREGRMRPAEQLIALGAIGAAVVYFVRHPLFLAQTAAGLAAILAGLYFFGYLAPRHALKTQPESETHMQPPLIPPAPPVAESAAQTPRAIASDASARNDAEAPAKPAKRPPQSRSIVAARDPALDGWFIKSYLRCWTPPAALPPGEPYAAQIRVLHNADGALAAGPVLVNPPSDPAWRAYAASAVRAVKKCNPLQVPSQYLPHFEQWRKMTLHFSPDSASE